MLRILGLGVLVLAAAGAFAAIGMDYLKPPFLVPTLSFSDQIRARPEPAGPAEPLPLLPDGPVRNVIFFLGDGMGLGHLAAARLYGRGADGRLTIERFPVTGLVATHSADEYVTDSAAGATAFATGYKTRNRMVSLSPDSLRLTTLIEAARTRGMATGIVTTSYMTDASAAAFATHAARRSLHGDIARQLVASGVDVLMGSGQAWFLPNTHPQSARADSLDLIAQARRLGYEVVHDAGALRQAPGPRLLGLFDADDLTSSTPSLTLAAMTGQALARLQQNPDGFFLLIEQEHIDTAAHRDQLTQMVRHLLHFDEAVALGVDFALRDGATLVIVTSDHETGGLSITGGNEENQELEVEWATFRHSATPVPLFAFGPNATRFTGFLDNTDVPRRIAEALGLASFPPPPGEKVR